MSSCQAEPLLFHYDCFLSGHVEDIQAQVVTSGAVVCLDARVLPHWLMASVEVWAVQATVLLYTLRFSWITVVLEVTEVLPLSIDQ